MEKVPADLDLATSLHPSEVRMTAHRLGIIDIPDQTALGHGITRLVDRDNGKIIDIATLRKDMFEDGRHAIIEYATDITADLARRDFTINAMAARVDPNGEVLEIIDPFGGQQDIKNKLVTFVGYAEHRIKGDYLRMLRAARFSALGPDWKIEPTHVVAIAAFSDNIHSIAKERIHDEILKAHKYPCPANFWRSLQSCQLLSHIIPDIVNTLTQDGGPHHGETVFEHLIGALEAGTELTENPLLRLAMVLHDIGKPVVVDREMHFYKHEVVGSTMVREWLINMKFSKQEVEYISTLVRHHMFHFESDTKDKTLRKWLQKVGPYWEDLIILRCADRRGNKAKAYKPMITTKMRELIERVQVLIDSGTPLFKEDLAINGDDIQALGIPPGPVYRNIFANLLGIVVSDPSKNTKEWLTEYVTKHYKEKQDEQAH